MGKRDTKAFKKDHFDLCIFDVMMPKKDGFTLAKEVRQKDAEIPIVFLTAKTLKQDILEGFKTGADDYISKPFNSEELLYRIQAILKEAKKLLIQEKKSRSLPLGNIILIILWDYYSIRWPIKKISFLQKKRIS